MDRKVVELYKRIAILTTLNLGTKKVKKTQKEWIRRKRKTLLDVGGEEDTLTFTRLGLGLPLRQPLGAVEGRVVVSLLLIKGRTLILLKPHRKVYTG